MQQTRRHILGILQQRGEATVDEIVEELEKRRGKEITAVTVRHHLTRLQQDDLITMPQMRHRNTPGRPQHVYALSERAKAQLPNNYQRLASSLLEGMRSHLSPEGINVILEDVAERMAQEAQLPELPLQERLNAVVQYLNKQGYNAGWQSCEGGYILQTNSCPYHHLVRAEDDVLCEMDMRYVSTLLGIVPRRLTHMVSGDESCAYLIPNKDGQ